MGNSESDAETCGRCAMSSVSGAMEEEHDPFDGERIEVDEGQLRRVSPGVVLGRLKDRIDGVVSKLTYGR